MSLRIGALVVAIGLFIAAWNAGARHKAGESTPTIPGVAPDDVAAVRRALREVSSLLASSDDKTIELWQQYATSRQLDRLFELQLRTNDWKGATQTCLAGQQRTPKVLDLLDAEATVDALEKTSDAFANLDALRELPHEIWLCTLLEFTRRLILRNDDRAAKQLIARAKAVPRDDIDPEIQAFLVFDLAYYQAILNQRADSMESMAIVHRLWNRPFPPKSAKAFRIISESIDPVALRNVLKEVEPPEVVTIQTQEISVTLARQAGEDWESAVAREVVKELQTGELAKANQLLEGAEKVPLVDRDEVLSRIADACRDPATDPGRIESLSCKLGTGNDLEQKLLSRIALTVARGGDIHRGTVLAGGISNASRRTQTILEIATLVARAGRSADALEIVAAMKPPQMWDDRSGVPDREPFDFRDPKTWVKPYEWFPGNPECPDSRAEHFVADLAHAAMAFHMAMGGKGVDQLPALFANEPGRLADRVGSEIIRRMIKAQAEGKDIRGALRWCAEIRNRTLPGADESLSEKYLAEKVWMVRHDYISATLGVAEGMLERSDQVRSVRR